MSGRPLPARVGGALICLWSALLSVQLQVAGCAHSPGTVAMADPSLAGGPGLDASVPLGSELRVRLRDGHTVGGEYRGIERQPLEEYAPRYDAWRARHPAAGWPALGDTVRISTAYGGTRTGAFEGFDWGAIRLRQTGDGEHVRLEDARMLVTPAGAAFSADTIARLRDAGGLPLCGVLLVDEASSGLTVAHRQIPLDEVASLEVKQGDQWVAAVIVGALAGAALVLVLIAFALRDAERNCGGSVSSIRSYPAAAFAPSPRR